MCLMPDSQTEKYFFHLCFGSNFFYSTRSLWVTLYFLIYVKSFSCLLSGSKLLGKEQNNFTWYFSFRTSLSDSTMSMLAEKSDKEFATAYYLLLLLVTGGKQSQLILRPTEVPLGVQVRSGVWQKLSCTCCSHWSWFYLNLFNYRQMMYTF